MLPRATYRIQFRKEFPFAACAAEADYLQRLGVSHVYASPILTARAGSAHGYDIVRYDEINPEIGGEEGFRAMAEALRVCGIGVILDVVPNHMAVGGADNPMWLDCLRQGQKSRYAGWFDIDFQNEDLAGKILAPFLGEPLSEALDRGLVTLAPHGEAAGYAICYGEHIFPVRGEDEDEISARGVAAFGCRQELERLIARQNYVLDWWRNAGDRINWRRFFDITHLAAMRMEQPEAFRAAHAVAFELYAQGLVDGLRIDHIDGLADPGKYCRDLRHALDALEVKRPTSAKNGRAWLLVEKILAPGEKLPAGWDVDGSTGYDFMDQISALQHDPAAEDVLARQWSAASGRPASFHDEEEAARREILDVSFAGQRERLVDAFASAASARSVSALPRGAFRRACTDVLGSMRAYRGYATGEAGEAPDAQIDAAFAAAMQRPLADRHALELMQDIIRDGRDQSPERATLLRRFHQLSAPLAAKAVEDTAFYRYGRLLPRNDVGFDAGRLGAGPAEFHAWMQARAEGSPRAMLATATHDHKRGEDIRARLAVLSEIPETWTATSARWVESMADDWPMPLATGDVLMLLQMLVGAWPPDLAPDHQNGLSILADRLGEWWVKALREGKLRSSWIQPDSLAEDSARAFVARILDPRRGRPFLSEVHALVEYIGRAGAANALIQMAIRCLAPGVPDTYQGTEFWDFSLVDPDNRREVDFSMRREALLKAQDLTQLLSSWRDGWIKQSLLARLMHLRAALQEPFANGAYVPVKVTGIRKEHVIAFLRQSAKDVVLFMGIRCMLDGMYAESGLSPSVSWWGDTTVEIPEAAQGLVPVVGSSAVSGMRLLPGDVLGGLPFAVWASPHPP